MVEAMSKPPIYNDMPEMYLFCNHTEYPCHNKRLHFQAAVIVSQGVPHYEATNISHVTGNERECSYFGTYTLATFALGVNHILDDTPYKEAMVIQNSLKSLMGKSMYHHTRNRQRRLRPLEQRQVADIFLEYNIKTKTNFDEYIGGYDW